MPLSDIGSSLSPAIGSSARHQLTDQRLDVYAIPSASIRAQTSSVGCIIRAEDLSCRVERDSPYRYKLRDNCETLAQQALRIEKLPLCPGEPFADQPGIGLGSGGFVGKDLFLTAGHCVAEEPLAGLRVVFQYAITDESQGCPRRFKREDVYKIKRIVGYEEYGNVGHGYSTPFGYKADWALLQLDREVEGGRLPLQLDFTRKVRDYTPIYMLSYPFGLPLKYSGNAQTLPRQTAVPDLLARKPDDYYNVNLDGAAGSSGGMVFLYTTSKVAAIFIASPRLRQDYKSDFEPLPSGHVRFYRCDDTPEVCQALYPLVGLKKYLQAVEAGSAEPLCKRKLAKTQKKVGDYFLRGTLGFAINNQEALAFYEKAAENGNKEAAVAAAQLYVDRSKATAIMLKYLQTVESNPLLHGLTQASLALIQNEMGGYFNTGIYVPKNEQMALECFIKAAENGCKEAAILVAVHYKKNKNRANATAIMLKYLQTVESNPALHGLTQARLALIQEEVGRYFKEGINVLKNKQMALECYVKAAANGNNRKTAYQAGKLCKLLGKKNKEWSGWNSDSRKMAFTHFKMAAERDHKKAQYKVSDMLFYGVGTKTNEKEAYHWLKQSADNGYEKAKVLRDKIRKDGYWGDYKIKKPSKPSPSPSTGCDKTAIAATAVTGMALLTLYSPPLGLAAATLSGIGYVINANA